jgi:deferrochelatase/peroxidase EfeB
VDDLGLNLLVGFGVRFFLGPRARREPEVVIPNFPPGGVFAPRYPTRFGIDRKVPLYLRTMNAFGDREWVMKRQTEERHGKPPPPADIERAYAEWVARGESDLLLYIESGNRYLNLDLWVTLRRRLVDGHGLTLSRPPQQGSARGDGRDHIGWMDPISNMDDLIASNPKYYRSKIYLPHPAPNYPGESISARDEPRYDGGTYLVHRKYLEHLDRWFADDFTMTDSFGRTYTGEEARQHAIGRDRRSGRVLQRGTDRQLDHEPDAAEVHLAYSDSHVLKARGGSPAPFRGPFPPLQHGEEHVFHIQDIRIRRRGASFTEVDEQTGAVRHGIHFVCFQNNIQQTGFEFINNIWLLNPAFRGGVDHLLDVERGIIEPLEGCYYFIPPEHARYPGDVFFD